MFMPAAVNAMVYGPAGAMAPGPKLQKILAKVWEHLASRVEDLEAMERRAGLLEEEVRKIAAGPGVGPASMGRVNSDLRTLQRHSEARAKELSQKFRQVMGFQANLHQRFPASKEPLQQFFGALGKASRRVDERYRQVGRVLARVEGQVAGLGSRQAVASPTGGDAPARAEDIRARVERMRAERMASAAPEAAPEVPAAPAPAPTKQSVWDSSWEDDVAAAIHEPVPVARPVGDPIENWESNLAAPGADSMYARSATRGAGEERVSSYSSARELIRARYERLKQKAAGGASTKDLEREIRSHRPGDGPAPVEDQPPPDRYGPPQPVDGEELLEDFLEADTVMDPYLSKAVPRLTAPDQAGDARMAATMKELLARRGGPTVRPAPKVGGLGNFATRLEHELELAARTEGLDQRASFRQPQRPKVPLPKGSRSVKSIMAELEALDQE
jgi:hypothetical protein